MGIYYEELAHTVTEAEKSHSPLSASWRPSQSGGIMESESEGLRTKGPRGVNTGQKAGEDETKCPGSISKAGKKGQIPLSCTFCFIRALN